MFGVEGGGGSGLWRLDPGMGNGWNQVGRRPIHPFVGMSGVRGHIEWEVGVVGRRCPEQ